MRVFLTSILFFVVAASCSARLGETEAELIQRFGKPISRTTVSIPAEGRMWEIGYKLTFNQEDWSIGCDLIDGRCARIGYSKRGEWTEAHIQTVLNANAQGAKWTEQSNPSAKKMVRTWKRDDSAEAGWSMISGMSITTPAYNRAKAIAEAKAKAKAGERAKI